MKNKKAKQMIKNLIPTLNSDVTCVWWSYWMLFAQVRVVNDEFGFDDVKFKQGVIALTADQHKAIK